MAQRPTHTAGKEPGLDPLFGAVRELVARCAPDGRILDLSPDWQPGPAHPAPASVTDLAVAGDRQRMERLVAQARAHEVVHCTARHAATGIELRWTLLSGSNGRAHLFASSVDPDGFTAHAMAHNTAAGIALIDTAGRYAFVNEAFCKLNGFAAEELIGREFSSVVAAENVEYALANHRRVLAGDSQDAPREMLLVRRDGRSILIRSSSRRIVLPGGDMYRLSTVTDVTDTRARERRLADAEARLRDLTDAIPGAIYRLERSPDGGYTTTFMSEGFRALTGLPDNVELSSFDTVMGLIPRYHRERAVALAEGSARKLLPYDQELPIDGPAGRVWVQARAQPHREPDGTVVWNGLMLDVSDRKRAQTRLAEAEAQLRDINSTLPGAVYQFHHAASGELHFVYMSEGLRRLGELPADYPLEDFDAFMGLVPGDEQGPLLEAVRESERTLAPLHHEFRLVTPAGRRWVEARSIPFPDDGGVTCNGLLVDVTERHEARSEAARLNAILESTPDIVAITDTDGLIRYLNAGGHRLLRIPETQDVDGRRFLDFVETADGARLRHEAIAQAARAGSWEGEVTLVATDGTRIPASQTVLCHRDRRGRIARFSTIVRDLSERIAAERRIAASEARFRTLYDETPVMLHSVDREFRIAGVNAHWLEVTGYTRDEVVGRPLDAFYADATREWILETARPEFVRTGRLRETPCRVVRRDGSVLDTIMSVNAVYDGAGNYAGALTAMTDVTAQRRAEAEYRDIFDNATEGIYRSSADGRLLRANPALVRMHGFDTEAELLESITDIATEWYVDPKARDAMLGILARDDRVENFESEMYRRATGERVWISENVRAVRDADDRIDYYEGTVRNITAQYGARQLAARRGEVLEMIARNHPLTEILYEIVGMVEQHERRLTGAIFRLQDGHLYAEAAPGLSNACIRAVDGHAPSEVGSAIGTAVHGERHASDTELRAAHGRPSAFVSAVAASGYGAVVAVPIRDQGGAALGVLSAFMQHASETDGDIVPLLHETGQIASIAIEQYRLSQELVRQARYDPLTELPNRALLADRLALAISEARRGRYPVAVILLDLDEFKLVNDTLGHSAGDELLQKVAERLRHCLREGDTVARLGGDEFVLVVPLRGSIDPTDIAERVLASLQGSIPVANRELTAHPSIGISVYPQDGGTPEVLLQAADTAMYAAKHAGKNRYRYFADDMNQRMTERLRIEAELRNALDSDELVLHYQPRIALADGHVAGAEALLRWHHPERGVLSPDSFLPIAERGPLIGEIDRLVLREAAGRAARWQRAGHGLILSANLSTRELHAGNFGAEVARILADSGVEPAGLELEITESMLMLDFERATRQLRDLKERAPGLRIAIDDFGSGYSSLNYLRHLPIDTLKIDRSFVADLCTPDSAATARAIAKTITELGHNLGLRVVAEGVEQQAQADVLRAFGCHEAQGFLFDAALSADAFERRIAGDAPHHDH